MTLTAQPCDHTKVIHSQKYIRKWSAGAARLSNGSSPRSGKPFMGHTLYSENTCKSLKALDQGNAITRLVHNHVLLYKAT